MTDHAMLRVSTTPGMVKRGRYLSHAPDSSSMCARGSQRHRQRGKCQWCCSTSFAFRTIVAKQLPPSPALHSVQPMHAHRGRAIPRARQKQARVTPSQEGTWRARAVCEPLLFSTLPEPSLVGFLSWFQGSKTLRFGQTLSADIRQVGECPRQSALSSHLRKLGGHSPAQRDHIMF